MYGFHDTQYNVQIKALYTEVGTRGTVREGMEMEESMRVKGGYLNHNYWIFLIHGYGILLDTSVGSNAGELFQATI